MTTLTVTAYRSHRWIDTSAASIASDDPNVFFGVQARLAGRRDWLHMAEGGKPLLFSAESDALSWIAKASLGPIKARLAVPAKARSAPLSGHPSHAR